MKDFNFNYGSELKLHEHAIQRLNERFGLDEAYLHDILNQGKFVWLNGAGHGGKRINSRSGHLIYIPDQDSYCIVVMDNHSRLAVTVLNEEMAINSNFNCRFDEVSKLRAKRLALGYDAVPDINFLYLHAQSRTETPITIQIRTFSYNWKPVTCSIYKTTIKPDQINIERNYCTLADDQMNTLSCSILEKVNNKEIRPYCELWVSTGGGKRVKVSNKLDVVSTLENAELEMRWLN
ncbi:hypothetical protein [Rheinheimera hassiensis]|uniref:hypothetical protein n=1 Tax=Rheinheimera hassiensis TaxID=1193627 RepID=UPI001F06AF4C|nr:hypothetical protein [Rheinheimera hassiensis]